MNAIAMINLGLALADAAVRGVAIAAEGRDLVRRIATEERDPTDEEWAKINALSADLHVRIQGEAEA